MLKVFLSVSAFLLTLVACVWATVSLCRGPIERDLSKRSLEKLEQIEDLRLDRCEIAFVGRDGLVRGEVKSQPLKDAVEEALRDLYGARVIETEFVVRPYDAPWIMVERTGENTFEASGLVAGETEKRALAEGLAGALGGERELDLEVEVRERVETADWLADLIAVAGGFVRQADGGVAELRDGKLSMRGEVADVAAEESVIATAQEQFAEAGISLEFDLSVAPPPEPARFEIFPPEDGEIVAAGRVADLDSAQKLLAVLRSGGDWIIKDQIVVDPNTEVAPWVEGMCFLLPSVMTEVVGASVRMEGSKLRLHGQVSEDMLVAVTEVARQNFPSPEYELRNRLLALSPPREAMVSVLTYPDSVQLKGLLAEAELKERLVEAVRGAIDGGELLTDELQVDPNVMESTWVDDLVQLIPPYVQQVKRGGLTIYSNILAVEAVIDSDADRDRIWAMTEQFFPDDKYRRLLELRFPEEVEGGIAADPPEEE